MTAYLIVSVHALTAKSDTKSVIYIPRRDDKHTWFLHVAVPHLLVLRADLEELKERVDGGWRVGGERKIKLFIPESKEGGASGAKLVSSKVY